LCSSVARLLEAFGGKRVQPPLAQSAALLVPFLRLCRHTKPSRKQRHARAHSPAQQHTLTYSCTHALLYAFNHLLTRARTHPHTPAAASKPAARRPHGRGERQQDARGRSYRRGRRAGRGQPTVAGGTWARVCARLSRKRLRARAHASLLCRGASVPAVVCACDKAAVSLHETC